MALISVDSVISFTRYTSYSLHLFGVSHEDLKRSNFLLNGGTRPIVVDVGFSHFSPGGGLVKSAGGTIDYSSPEKVVVRLPSLTCDGES